MIEEKPRTLLFTALGLLLFGWVMPFLMVIHVVESTFFLNFPFLGRLCRWTVPGRDGCSGPCPQKE